VFVQRFDANRTHRLEKLDARTGASAWDADVTLGLYLPLSVALNVRVGASRVYLAREYQVDVLDLATGRTLGRLPPGGRWALQKPRRTWKVG
jgi:outer membrane protein assembly factor BamB